MRAKEERTGFTLIEMLVAITIIALLITLAYPFIQAALDVSHRAIDLNNQRLIQEAITRWEVDHNEQFVTKESGFGNGEVMLTMEGKALGDPSRDLTHYVAKSAFDCPADGRGEKEGCDYETDGYQIACLSDRVTALKGDGKPFLHDYPQPVRWDHALGKASTVPPEKYDLLETFDDGKADNWQVIAGSFWKVEDGIYSAGRNKGWVGEHRSFTGDEGWDDYTIELKAELTRGWGYGVYFRATDIENANGYIFQYNPCYSGEQGGSFLFRKIVNGKELPPLARVLKNEVLAPGFDWYNKVREIKIELSGNTFKAYVDGKLVLTGSDGSYNRGMIGLRTWGDSHVYFDDIRVKAKKSTPITKQKKPVLPSPNNDGQR
jgi:prepilin-type N-terminal cleavage/methylation domain-containing protein